MKLNRSRIELEISSSELDRSCFNPDPLGSEVQRWSFKLQSWGSEVEVSCWEAIAFRKPAKFSRMVTVFG